MYLEAIFSAPDIQRQLPIEAKLFTVVDKSWREIMRKTAKVSFSFYRVFIIMRQRKGILIPLIILDAFSFGVLYSTRFIGNIHRE